MVDRGREGIGGSETHEVDQSCVRLVVLLPFPPILRARPARRRSIGDIGAVEEDVSPGCFADKVTAASQDEGREGDEAALEFVELCGPLRARLINQLKRKMGKGARTL